MCEYECVSVWIAIGFGALDLVESEYAADGFDIVVVPATPGGPVFLLGEGAELWRRMAAGPVTVASLSAHEQEVARGLAEMGLASGDEGHPSRVRELNRPWLVSLFHELVYALISNVAASEGIDILFIKGPTLHAQGLRVREHSGDVDCWVRPGDDRKLAGAMEAWGWTPLFLPFTGTTVTHSLTLVAGEWGCAVDVHTSFPGIGLPPTEAFEALYAGSEMRLFAGAMARTPRVPEHAVIAALHDMRPYDGVPAGASAIEKSEFVLRRGGRSVLPVVSRLDAGFVLSNPLERVFGQEAAPFKTAAAPRDWGMRLETASSRRHFKALRLLPIRQRPAVLYRLVWPHSDTMRIAMGDRSATRLAVLRARVRRVGVSVRKLISRR